MRCRGGPTSSLTRLRRDRLRVLVARFRARPEAWPGRSSPKASEVWRRVDSSAFALRASARSHPCAEPSRRSSRAILRERRRMAERVGFEPTVEFPLHTLSKRAPSTTRTSLLFRINHLRAVWNSVAQNPPSNPAGLRCDLNSGVYRRMSACSSTELCKTF